MLTRRHFLQHSAGASIASLHAPNFLFGKETSVPAQSGILVESMERAGKCCLAWLNPEQQFLPTGGYEVAHDTGRWWDAMLRLEEATGTAIPAPLEAAMMKNLEILTDNGAALLTNTSRLPIPADKIKVNPHNLRETMQTYTALVRWRKSDWARKQGLRLIETISQTLDADGQMDYEKLAVIVGGPLTKDPLMVQRSPAGQWFNATATTGRALEAIVFFHHATAEGAAAKLSHRLAEIHFKQVIDLSGKVRAELTDPAHIGHTHSYFGTLRGLLIFGITRGKKEYIEAITNTYRKGIWGTSISHSGWTPHDQGKIRFPNKEGEPLGETASCGDVAQMALWLALLAGHEDLYDDVERLIRARLLPSQISDSKNPRNDGAWGVYSHPFGRGSILDVFAAVLHSETDFHNHMVMNERDGTTAINLHFNLQTPGLTIKYERQEVGRLLITPHHPQDLRIRVPGWAPRDKVSLTAAGKSLALHWEGSFLRVARADVIAGQTIILQYDLPTRETVEVMPVSGREFHLTWQGDTVSACSPTVPIYPAKKA